MYSIDLVYFSKVMDVLQVVRTKEFWFCVDRDDWEARSGGLELHSILLRNCWAARGSLVIG